MDEAVLVEWAHIGQARMLAQRKESSTSSSGSDGEPEAFTLPFAFVARLAELIYLLTRERC
jgi:hypothetical protein